MRCQYTIVFGKEMKLLVVSEFAEMVRTVHAARAGSLKDWHMKDDESKDTGTPAMAGCRLALMILPRGNS